MLKLAIIGAGSSYTPELMEGIINRKDIMPIRQIVLMDINTKKLNVVGGLVKRMVSHAKLSCDVTLTEDYDTALSGANFVFVQMRIGGLACRVLDEKIPLKYNLIGQETTGIGGFFKALRTIPVLMDIARRIEKLCPDAWVLNFTNPAGICAQALLDHTNVKVIGLCNAPFRIIDNPVAAFTDGEAEIDYIGLNHLSFLTSIRVGGKDFLQEAIKGNGDFMKKLEGVTEFETDVIRKVGGVPSYYMQYFLHQRKNLEKLKKAEKSRAEECMEVEEELLKMYQSEDLNVKPEALSKRGGARYSEAACSLAESIYTDDNKIHVVNAYNNGAIPFMADRDVVETRAHVGKNGAKMIAPKVLGNEYVKGIMQTIKAYEYLTVEAAIKGDRDTAITALMANPLISDYDTATACFNEMLEAHKAYLPQFSK